MSLKDLLGTINTVKDPLLIDFVEENIIKSYFEYFRAYHSFDNHILPGLHLLEKVRGLCEDSKLVELAWWYHDVVYIPGSQNNEAVSADKARFDCIQLGYGQKIASTVYNLVMATQHFVVEPSTQDEKVLHDIDLAILGEEPEKYHRYTQQIWEEYSFVNEKDYAQGRLQMLEKFIARSGSPTDQPRSIYLTRYFRDNYEKRALENMRDEMDMIKKSFPTPV